MSNNRLLLGVERNARNATVTEQILQQPTPQGGQMPDFDPRREEQRRAQCKSCPIDHATGVCKEHAVFAIINKWGFGAVMASSGLFLVLLLSLHWRISTANENIATLVTTVNHIATKQKEIAADLKYHLQTPP